MDINIESEEFESGEIARAYAVQEALQTAVDSAYQQADERQLHADVISYTVESCMQSCVSLLEMTFVSREPLDPDLLTETSWQPDPEAQPCAPDTWMRGVIQVRQPQRQPSVSTTGGTASPSKPPLSRSSSTRSNQASGSPRISKDVSRVPSRRTSRESLSGHDDSGTSTSSRKDGAASRAPQGKAGAAAARGPAKTGPQQEIEDRLREEVAIRKKEQQRHAEMLAKEEEDQQKFEALHKQLRGKDYGYDHKGQIVVINNVDPDSLPPVAAAPTVTTAAGEKKQRQNISQKPKDPPADSPKPKPKATLEADGPDFIADKKEVQPPVVDTIKLASGISLRAGAAVQSGPKRVVDIDHMTKRDHAKYLIKAAAENVVTLTGTKGTKGSKLPTQSSLGGKLQAQGSTAAKQAGIAAQIGSSATQPLKQRLQQQQQQQAAGSGSLALLTQVSDNEQLKWARDGVPRKVAAKVVERPPSPVDPTLALLSSADWGLSSAVKGRSPAQLPSKEALDADLPMLKTRDRAFKRGQIASIPVAAGLRSDMATPHVDTYGGSLGWAQ
ncbi:TPA: hypothetical protein ACH3X2_006773 [Trebouxia sp. C0005]